MSNTTKQRTTTRRHAKDSTENRRVPSLRLHKASGQAVVTLAGKDHYLGPHGTKASKSLYDRLIAEWLANDRRPIVDADADGRGAHALGELFGE